MQPTEDWKLNIDYAAVHDWGSTETIASIVSVAVTPTTVPPYVATSIGSSGKIAQVEGSGGVDGTKYKITVIVTTTDGNTLEGEFYVQVKDI